MQHFVHQQYVDFAPVFCSKFLDKTPQAKEPQEETAFTTNFGVACWHVWGAKRYIFREKKDLLL